MITKQDLRYSFINKRKVFTPNKDDINNFINNTLLVVNNRDIVSLYYPINKEIDSLQIIKSLNLNNVKTCIPYINNCNEMKFAEYKYVDNIKADKFKIPIPSNIKDCKPNIIIAPLLAFDKHGNRLGYGAGFYDETVYNLKNVLYLGIGYTWQEADYIPTEQTDVKLNGIITNKYIKYFEK